MSGVLFDLQQTRRTGPLEPFEKVAISGFAVAALVQAGFGIHRAGRGDASLSGATIGALGYLLCGLLWWLRMRRLPGGGLAVPAGLLVATLGVYAGYTATNAPFLGVLSRYSVPVLLILLGALLLFAEQDAPFQMVPFALAAVAFVVVQVVLTGEVRSGSQPVPPARAGVSGALGGSAIMTEMDLVAAARSFADAINDHDVAAIVAQATPDHRFIDSLGNTIARDQLRTAWEAYFRMVPDYRITVTRWIPDGNDVVAYGTASGTFTTGGTLRAEDAWSTPAAWRASIRDGRIAAWQVYADNEPIRERMRRAPVK